jgi:hypothetical protein
VSGHVTGSRADLSVRPAVPGDVEAMAAVYAQSVLAGGRGHYGPRELAAWADQGSAARFTAMLAEPAKALLVAEADGAVAGLAGLEGSEVILLYAGPTAPPGTGTALLAAVEALARDRGLGALSLVASRNALRFYLGRGYGILSTAVRTLPGEVGLPVCLMGKTLAGSVQE